MVIAIVVTEANTAERLGGVIALDEAAEKLDRLEIIWVDQGSIPLSRKQGQGGK
jgi:putative transposase